MSGLTYAQQQRLASRVTEPSVRQAIAALALPPRSHGLDAGCGIGSHCLWLCEATGGKVTGLDISRENLAVARQRVGEAPCADRVELVEGSLFALPFKAHSFDWCWCADTLWPVVVPEPVKVLNGLARAVRPGGTVALLYWTNQLWLPGFPQLEARLDGAFVGNTHYFQLSDPSQHHLRALGWLRRAGLEEPRAQSFVAEYQAPLADAVRESLAFCFSMFYADLGSRLDASDQAEYQRLCSPDSPDCVLDCPDYYCQLIYTLFHARVPQNSMGSLGE